VISEVPANPAMLGFCDVGGELVASVLVGARSPLQRGAGGLLRVVGPWCWQGTGRAAADGPAEVPTRREQAPALLGTLRSLSGGRAA